MEYIHEVVGHLLLRHKYLLLAIDYEVPALIEHTLLVGDPLLLGFLLQGTVVRSDHDGDPADEHPFLLLGVLDVFLFDVPVAYYRLLLHVYQQVGGVGQVAESGLVGENQVRATCVLFENWSCTQSGLFETNHVLKLVLLPLSWPVLAFWNDSDFCTVFDNFLDCVQNKVIKGRQLLTY